MGFVKSTDPSGVTVVRIVGQLIVGNRQELKTMVQEGLDKGETKFLIDCTETGVYRFLGPWRAGDSRQEGARIGRRPPDRRPQRGSARSF